MSDIKVNRITNANVYLDNDSFLGQVEEVNAPEIKFKKSPFKALGLFFDVDFTSGIEKMEFKMKTNSFYPKLLKKLADPTTQKAIQIRGSMQVWEGRELSGEQPVVVYMNVQSQSFPGAAFKQTDNVEMESGFNVFYYKLEINGEEILEIDVLNNIFIVDGVDKLQAYRANLGI